MSAPRYEPKTLHHPQSKKAKVTEISGLDPVSGRPFKDYQGEPDLFPDVTVSDPETEAYYRARGYLFGAETPPPPPEYAEYPVMLVHPEHVDAVPDDWHVEKQSTGEVVRTRIPGSPEKFPPRAAANAEEEAAWGAKGYKRAGKDDPDAIRTGKAVPYNPAQKHEEWPKMVKGVVIDPNEQVGGPIQYPKWIGDRLVNSAAEEIELTGSAPPAVLDECIICGEPITEEDPVGNGPKGSYHLSHMAPAPKARRTRKVKPNSEH